MQIVLLRTFRGISQDVTSRRQILTSQVVAQAERDDLIIRRDVI